MELGELFQAALTDRGLFCAKSGQAKLYEDRDFHCFSYLFEGRFQSSRYSLCLDPMRWNDLTLRFSDKAYSVSLPKSPLETLSKLSGLEFYLDYVEAIFHIHKANYWHFIDLYESIEDFKEDLELLLREVVENLQPGTGDSLLKLALKTLPHDFEGELETTLTLEKCSLTLDPFSLDLRWLANQDNSDTSTNIRSSECESTVDELSSFYISLVGKLGDWVRDEKLASLLARFIRQVFRDDES